MSPDAQPRAGPKQQHCNRKPTVRVSVNFNKSVVIHVCVRRKPLQLCFAGETRLVGEWRHTRPDRAMTIPRGSVLEGGHGLAIILS